MISTRRESSSCLAGLRKLALRAGRHKADKEVTSEMETAFLKACFTTLAAVAITFVFVTVQVGGPQGWFSGMGLVGGLTACFWTGICTFPIALFWFLFRGRHRS